MILSFPFYHTNIIINVVVVTSGGSKEKRKGGYFTSLPTAEFIS